MRRISCSRTLLLQISRHGHIRRKERWQSDDEVVVAEEQWKWVVEVHTHSQPLHSIARNGHEGRGGWLSCLESRTRTSHKKRRDWLCTHTHTHSSHLWPLLVGGTGGGDGALAGLVSEQQYACVSHSYVQDFQIISSIIVVYWFSAHLVRNKKR